MSLKIYNTLTRAKEAFRPQGKEATMYVCGPTVYDLSHIGHARTYISFDILNSYLKNQDFDVKYAINITDVDDKILDRSKKENRDAKEFTEEMTQKFLEDFKSLGNTDPDLILKVTENMPAIIDFIKTLIDKDYAYEAGGDVYFSVRKFKDYGKLSGNNIEDLESGARVQPGEDKKDPLDFALWKKSKEGETISFDSPWGKGRPGWHIECSVMAVKYLGKTLDIHGGGQDLIFPHHEDEIAQSEAANGVPFVKNWVHTGMVNVSGEKMSKSLGNFTTIRDLLKKYPKEVLRFHVLKTHYRSPLDFNETGIKESQRALESLQEFAVRIEPLNLVKTKDSAGDLKKHREDFFQAMDDDLNTPKALSAIFMLMTELNKEIELGRVSPSTANETLFFLKEVEDIFKIGLFEKRVELSVQVKEMIEEYKKAKESKDWDKVDQIRKEFNELGFAIEDTSWGPRIKRINKE